MFGFVVVDEWRDLGNPRWGYADVLPYAACLGPVRGRANLTVITGALATGVVLDGDRATGVRARVGGVERVIRHLR